MDDCEEFLVHEEFEIGDPGRWTSVDDNLVEDLELETLGGEGYVKLFRLEHFGASLYGSEDGTSKSHSHVGAVALV